MSENIICDKIKINKNLLDFLVKNVKIDMESCDRSICEEKYKDFINNCKTESGKELVRDIYKQTRYINFKEFKEKLLKLINYIVSKYEKYNVYFNIDKIGSENWLVLLAWDKLKQGCEKIIEDYRDIDNDHPILFIDDCIYTGISMCGHVDVLQYDYKYKINNEKDLLNECVVIVPFCGKNGYHQLKDFRVSLYVYEYIEELEGYDADYLYKRLRCESIPYPIYFDHKIANEFGSFPQIYNKIIKNKPSRECIENIEKVLN